MTPRKRFLLSQRECWLRWTITSLTEGEGSLRTIPPHIVGEGTFWQDGFCSFAFGSAQNDRFEKHTAQSESLRIGETTHKGVWCYAHWLLMQSTLFVEALCLDVAFIGCWNCVRWLLRFCTLAVDTLSIDVDAECTDVNFAFIGCWRFVYCLKMLCALAVDTLRIDFIICILMLMLFEIAVDTACTDYWLIPPAMCFDWFMCWVLNKSRSFRAFW